MRDAMRLGSPHLQSLPGFASIAPDMKNRNTQAVTAQHPSAPTPFVLCADDYGFSPGISSAIRDLIDRGRLSATSCMTMSPFWPDHASWLKPYADQVDVGLHLTLTDHAPLGSMPRTAPDGRLPPLPVLMRKSFTGQLDQGEIDSELNRQLDAFETAFGRAPSHIDGHHHIHQLPVVRKAVVRAVTTRYRGEKLYVRLCDESYFAILRRGIEIPKSLLISSIGRGLRKLARKHTIAGSDSFRGVYDFSDRVPFGTLMDRFVEDIPPKGLVMCHPGIPDEELRGLDCVVGQRRVEYDWLGGHGLPTLLAKQNLRLSRFFA
jgi:chitin disaccharide deacetylase